MFTRHAVRDRWVPLVCIAAPVLSWCLQQVCSSQWGYQIGFELLLYNAAFTILGLLALRK